MTNNYDKSPRQLFASSLALLVLFSGMYGIQQAFAENETTVNVFATDEIMNNPALLKILENMEKSKKEFFDAQQKVVQDNYVDEQRNAAKILLEKQLQQMFKDNEEYTPISAFNKFLKTIPDDDTKNIFKGLFDYQQEKVSAAREAMRDVFKNGGTLQEARDAYHEAAAVSRADMVDLVKSLNIETEFSDPDVQKHFDADGKLPRYDSEQESIVSFVDFTTVAKNVNSSTKNIVVENTTKSTLNSNSTDSNVDQEKTLIQKLLEEIQFLKNKIKSLEEKQSNTIHKTTFEEYGIDSIHFADWVSDYSKGLGHQWDNVKDIKSIPVNALNEPDSYDDINNSLALGRQGQVVLSFEELVTDKLTVFEASKEKNIRELATVEVSSDGENWILLTQTQFQKDDSYVHEYSYDLSDAGCIAHVRITDNSSSSWGDGFDVDAVGATQTCTDNT